MRELFNYRMDRWTEGQEGLGVINWAGDRVNELTETQNM